MTEAQKAEIFDDLQRKRVIEVRKDTSKTPTVTHIIQAQTKDIVVPDWVVSLAGEGSK